jgi:hypothetical protein
MLIPENLLRLMSAADRKVFGRAGWTIADVQERVDLRLERKLHADFSGFLRRHEDRIALVHHTNPTKRTRSTIGEPDYCIHFMSGKTAFLEFKVNGNKLSRQQEIISAKLRSAGFQFLVTGSYEEAISFTQGFFG